MSARTILLAMLVGAVPCLAVAQVSVSPYVTPAYGADTSHSHKAYPVSRYGISCPGDRVVWVNTNTGVYHLEGERWFGRTRGGEYECEKAALSEGDRETRNGQ